IPQFTNASESAKSSSLNAQMQTIRSQLELYQLNHNGGYPDLTAEEGWQPLTDRHSLNADGTLDYTGSGLGPYLQQPPRNPFVGGPASTAIADISEGDSFDANAGWGYDPTTGTIKAMIPA